MGIGIVRIRWLREASTLFVLVILGSGAVRGHGLGTGQGGQGASQDFWTVVRADPVADLLGSRHLSARTSGALLEAVRSLKAMAHCNDPDPDGGITCSKHYSLYPMVNVNVDSGGPYDVVIWKSKDEQSPDSEAAFGRFCSAIFRGINRPSWASQVILGINLMSNLATLGRVDITGDKLALRHEDKQFVLEIRLAFGKQWAVYVFPR